MKTTKELFKKHKNDAGWDIYSTARIVIPPKLSAIIPTKLHVAIPEGCVGLLWSRSGLSIRHDIEVGAGCIDSGYTGEVMVKLYNFGYSEYVVEISDRIAQLLVIPVILSEYTLVDSLDDSSRGIDGIGSSGK
jgi:dUTP pyrophosphatase